MSNRKQELDKAIQDSVTPVAVAKQVKPQVKAYTKAVIVTRHTVADAIGKAQAEALSKTFA
jgi:hypothetical protein